MRKNNLKAAVIGKDGRTSAIQHYLNLSPRLGEMTLELGDGKNLSSEAAKQAILQKARQQMPDFVVVGPEEPLAEGIVDELQGIGIPCVGPAKRLALLESSKAFTRQLLSKYKIPGNPEYRVFKTMSGVAEYLKELEDFVVKPDGLTGGKGVKVSGDHLHSIEQGVDYCEELILNGSSVVVEEKLDGEEFSLQSFCDGTHVRHMVVVQDHKRVGVGDTGPNTGGMGSYSCENGSLPFLLPQHVEAARAINEAIPKALFAEIGQKYKGILFGGFMLTRSGIRLLEYNARFGDPEALNALSVLKTDLVDIFEAIIDEKLGQLPVDFERRATVCKYVVPDGYPENPVKGEKIRLTKTPKESENLKIFRASLDERDGSVFLSGSRAIAFVGIGKDLSEAQTIAEEAARSVEGPVFHREDIGTQELVQQRVNHIRALQGNVGGKKSFLHSNG